MKTTDLIKGVKNKIVFIGFKQKQENNQYMVSISGTGFLYEKKYIISCAHIYNQIPKNEGIEVFIGVLDKSENHIDTYKTQDVDFVSKDDQRDIAIFKLRTEIGEDKCFKNSDFELDETNIQAGKEVLFVGFPLANDFLKIGIGITLFANKCIVGAVKYSSIDNKIDFVQIDSHVNPSNSGSPLFDNETGKIVGVVSGTFNNTVKSQVEIQIPRNMGIVKPALYITALIPKDSK
jgi:S1-C subfamily serine protease